MWCLIVDQVNGRHAWWQHGPFPLYKEDTTFSGWQSCSTRVSSYMARYTRLKAGRASPNYETFTLMTPVKAKKGLWSFVGNIVSTLAFFRFNGKLSICFPLAQCLYMTSLFRSSMSFVLDEATKVVFSDHIFAASPLRAALVSYETH